MLRLSKKNYFQAFLFTLVVFSIFVNHMGGDIKSPIKILTEY